MGAFVESHRVEPHTHKYLRVPFFHFVLSSSISSTCDDYHSFNTEQEPDSYSTGSATTAAKIKKLFCLVGKKSWHHHPLMSSLPPRRMAPSEILLSGSLLAWALQESDTFLLLYNEPKAFSANARNLLLQGSPQRGKSQERRQFYNRCCSWRRPPSNLSLPVQKIQMPGMKSYTSKRSAPSRIVCYDF